MFVRYLFIHIDIHSILGAWPIPHTREGAALHLTVLPS